MHAAVTLPVERIFNLLHATAFTAAGQLNGTLDDSWSPVVHKVEMMWIILLFCRVRYLHPYACAKTRGAGPSRSINRSSNSPMETN